MPFRPVIAISVEKPVPDVISRSEKRKCQPISAAGLTPGFPPGQALLVMRKPAPPDVTTPASHLSAPGRIRAAIRHAGFHVQKEFRPDLSLDNYFFMLEKR